MGKVRKKEEGRRRKKKEEGRRKKEEEGRRRKKEEGRRKKEKPYIQQFSFQGRCITKMRTSLQGFGYGDVVHQSEKRCKVNISPTFTRDYTSGHDISLVRYLILSPVSTRAMK